MKKQSLLFFLLACSVSTFAMHRDRRTVYVEGEAFTKQYHACWQKLKHALSCSCCSGSLCKSAIRGAYSCNLSLLIPHLPWNTDNEAGAELFNCMLQGKETSHYCDILELLMKRGFNPTKSYGEFRPAISSIIGLQNIDLFKLAAQIPFENEIECKEVFGKLYRHIEVRPEEDRTFYYQALAVLAEKNPHTSNQIVSARIATRHRTTGYRSVDSANPPLHVRRIPIGRHSVPQAWER